ncbi:MAG: sigma-54-dependent transcriptional regulator, partial [Planctomycetota bacterium]
MGKILLVDDDSSITWAFERFVTSMGHDFLSAATAEEGVEIARREAPDFIFMDVRLPGKDGLWAVERIRETLPDIRIVVITAHGTLETAMRSMKLGAVEYVGKPIDLDRARRMVEEALGRGSSEIESLRGEAGTTGIVGKSPVMQEVFRKVAAVCQSEATVLITGESGTGKELLARAIHHGSPRAGGPFEAINCASIPESLLESELYGHEKGAFTGAVRQKKGKLELGDGGTLFLDEIGDLSTAAQVKLLRFLEERAFDRVGGTEQINVDVRLIAATNQNLEELIRQGRFREDL